MNAIFGVMLMGFLLSMLQCGAAACLVTGLLGLGAKKRAAFWWLMASGACQAVRSVFLHDWTMSIVGAAVLGAAVLGFLAWWKPARLDRWLLGSKVDGTLYRDSSVATIDLHVATGRTDESEKLTVRVSRTAAKELYTRLQNAFISTSRA